MASDDNLSAERADEEIINLIDEAKGLLWQEGAGRG